MLAAAWPATTGSACGWALLRKASLARPGRGAAAVAVAAASASGAARRGLEAQRRALPSRDPRAALAASLLSGLAAVPCPANQGPRLRLRSPAAEVTIVAARWASAVGSRRRRCCCCCKPAPGGGGGGAPGQPSRSRSGHGAGPGSSEGDSGGQARRRQKSSDLYENPWTIPNFLSMARIGLAPVLGYLIVEEDFNIALGVFALAGITDLLDGFIARNWANQKSVLGSALDPLADKFLISILYISLTCANLIPVPLTSMVVLRDVALIAAVFYIRYKTLPPPRTLSKYFNPCYATAQLKPTFISKANTVVQLVLVAASLAAPVFNYVDSMYLRTLWCITACTTTASAYSYYHYGQKTVHVLKGK